MSRIRIISAADTHDLRQRVLRVDRPSNEVVFDGDNEATHLGLFDPDLVGIASLYKRPFPHGSDAGDWQLRGMAVDDSHRGTGVGRELVEASLDHVRRHGGRRLWCNARKIAIGFYERQGFVTVGDWFDVPRHGLHIVMVKAVDS
jgi:GNAT superfamily N-acetyltransferase